MSQDLLDDGPIYVTAFFGGTEKGAMLQLAPRRHDYAQLNPDEAFTLVKVLVAWLGEQGFPCARGVCAYCEEVKWLLGNGDIEPHLFKQTHMECPGGNTPGRERR
jgi:hypothetical protein